VAKFANNRRAARRTAGIPEDARNQAAPPDARTADATPTATATLPTTEAIRSELAHERYRNRFHGAFRNTVFILIVVAAVAVLTAVLLLPVLRIYGDSMHGTLDTGDVVVSVKTSDFNTGDIMAFYYNNNVLVKRVIAQAGDWINIDSDGNVYVNDKQISEPYLSSKAYGQTNIKLPYQVPEGKVFVMGDNRAVSIDSRNTAVGCVSSEQIVGRIAFRVWPLSEFGPVN
jgi:signal peptidase I